MPKKASNKKTKIYGILLAVLVIAIGGWFIGSKFLKTDLSKELTTVRMPIDIWPGNFWVAIADAKGFFEEEGLKAELIDVSANYNQLVDDFATKDFIDAMNFSVFDLVNKDIKGANLVAVFVSDSSEGAEGLVAKKEFEKLADLKGKRIGVEIGSYLDFFLEVAMLNAGLSPEEYIKVNLVTDDIISEFEANQLDATFAWEPQLSEIATKFNLHKIFDTSDIRGLSPGVFAFKRQYIKDNPETVQAIVRVWKKASDYILTHKEESYGLISGLSFEDNPNGNYTYKEIEDLAKQDPILSLDGNLKAFSFSAGFESIYGNLQFVSRFFQESGNAAIVPNTNDMLTDYFIRNISQTN